MNTRDNKAFESGFTLIELMIVCIILVFCIGMICAIMTSIQRSYSQQRVRTEAVNDATAALDMITRLIRMAGNNPNSIAGLQGIDPESPVGGIYRSIHIRSDWRGTTMSSMPDGDTDDPFENIRFLVQNNTLMKQESSDPSPVEFLDNVIDIQFLYYDTHNLVISDPVTNNSSIARIDVTIIMQSPRSTPQTFTSSAYLRIR
jgi:prepilin-type N-terminal cleavage/methylation domain-containing protein